MTYDCRCAIICGGSTLDTHRGRMFWNAVGFGLLLRQKAFPVWLGLPWNSGDALLLVVIDLQLIEGVFYVDHAPVGKFQVLA